MFEEIGFPEIIIICVTIVSIMVLSFLRKPKVASRVFYIEKFPEVLFKKCRESGDSIEVKIHGENAKFIKKASPAIAHVGRKIYRIFLTIKDKFETIPFPEKTKKGVESELTEFEIGVYASKTFFQAIFSQLKEIKQRLIDILIGGIAGAGLLAIIIMFTRG